MARPKARELTERELEIMHVFWEEGEMTAHAVRDRLAQSGRDLAYTTVATLIRILLDKDFLTQTHNERPFHYAPARSFEDVSGSLVHDLIERVFGGSREHLLIRLMNEQLTARERKALKKILQEKYR